MEKDLIVREKSGLPATIEELQEYILIGRARLKVYKEKVKLIKDLNLATKVKDQALEDGQSVGEAVLLAEAKLGELLRQLPIKVKMVRREVQIREHDKKSADGKIIRQSAHKRISPTFAGPEKRRPAGMTQSESYSAQKISKHPEIVEEVIKEAKEKGDIPTKYQAIKKINEKLEKERKEKAAPPSKIELIGDELQYKLKLAKVLLTLPPHPPKHLSEEGYKVLSGMVRIIIKRVTGSDACLKCSMEGTIWELKGQEERAKIKDN